MLLVVLPGAFAMKAKKKKKQKATSEIISVSIHHTVCFGMCPDYIVDINKDGTATYTAKRFTPDTGIFKKNIGKAKAKEIIGMAVKYRIDTCSEMYDNRIPDLPGLNVTVNFAKKKKTIYSAHFGPEFLTEIANAMDEVGRKTETNNTGWRKTGMPKLD